MFTTRKKALITKQRPLFHHLTSFRKLLTGHHGKEKHDPKSSNTPKALVSYLTVAPTSREENENHKQHNNNNNTQRQHTQFLLFSNNPVIFSDTIWTK